jgi:hypothetical protein
MVKDDNNNNNNNNKEKNKFYMVKDEVKTILIYMDLTVDVQCALVCNSYISNTGTTCKNIEITTYVNDLCYTDSLEKFRKWIFRKGPFSKL